MQVRTQKVSQGSNVSMDVVVDKAANLNANIYVEAVPEGAAGGGITLSSGLPEGQTKCTASGGLPIDAKVGKWVITKILLRPLPGGEDKELSKHGDSSFEVVARGKIILPDSATISDIK